MPDAWFWLASRSPGLGTMWAPCSDFPLMPIESTYKMDDGMNPRLRGVPHRPFASSRSGLDFKENISRLRGRRIVLTFSLGYVAQCLWRMRFRSWGRVSEDLHLRRGGRFMALNRHGAQQSRSHRPLAYRLYHFDAMVLAPRMETRQSFEIEALYVFVFRVALVNLLTIYTNVKYFVLKLLKNCHFVDWPWPKLYRCNSATWHLSRFS